LNPEARAPNLAPRTSNTEARSSKSKVRRQSPDARSPTPYEALNPELLAAAATSSSARSPALMLTDEIFILDPRP